MSTTYDLECTMCRVRLWVGQSTDQTPPIPFYLYTHPREAIQRLTRFLHDHRGHALIFDDEHSMEQEREYVEESPDYPLDEPDNPNPGTNTPVDTHPDRFRFNRDKVRP